MSASKLNKKNSNNVIITWVIASVPLMKKLRNTTWVSGSLLFASQWNTYLLSCMKASFFMSKCRFLWVFKHFIWNKLGTDSNEIWPTSTWTGRADRWSTSVLLTVKMASDLSDSLSKCTVDTGDNGASNCSQMEHCYLYANEEGSKNFIWKHHSKTYIEFASLMRDAHVADTLTFIWLCNTGKMMEKYIHVMTGFFCSYQRQGCGQKLSI